MRCRHPSRFGFCAHTRPLVPFLSCHELRTFAFGYGSLLYSPLAPGYARAFAAFLSAAFADYLTSPHQFIPSSFADFLLHYDIMPPQVPAPAFSPRVGPLYRFSQTRSARRRRDARLLRTRFFFFYAGLLPRELHAAAHAVAHSHLPLLPALVCIASPELRTPACRAPVLRHFANSCLVSPAAMRTPPTPIRAVSFRITAPLAAATTSLRLFGAGTGSTPLLLPVSFRWFVPFLLTGRRLRLHERGCTRFMPRALRQYTVSHAAFGTYAARIPLFAFRQHSYTKRAVRFAAPHSAADSDKRTRFAAWF